MQNLKCLKLDRFTLFTCFYTNATGDTPKPLQCSLSSVSRVPVTFAE